MRLFSNLDNTFIINEKITLQEGVLLEWFLGLPSWANSVIIENKVFYFASKTKACSDIPHLTDKVDTMYRYYKKLEKGNFVELKKVDGKDYVHFLEKCKKWNSSNYSDNHPTTIGQTSENDSDNFPIYSNIQNNSNIHDSGEVDLFNNPLKDKKNKKEKQAKEKVLFPFDSENFIQQWEIWKDYKSKEHRFKFKSVQSEQAALKNLSELSKGIEENAIKIIHQSLANGWKGFFELKINGDAKKQQFDQIGIIATNWKRNNIG